SRIPGIAATSVGASVGGGAGSGVGGFGVAPGPGGNGGMLSWQAAPSVATLAVVSRRKTSRRRIIGAIVDFVCSNAGPYVVRKDLGRPRGSRGAWRVRPALYRPAPGSRSHLTPGVRRTSVNGPPGAPTGADHRHDGPQHAHLAAVATGHRYHRQGAARRPRAQLQRIRR